MPVTKTNIYTGNINDKDHIQDWIALFKETLGNNNVEISDSLNPKCPNIILEEFTRPEIIDELKDFKIKFPKTKIIVFLTEFLDSKRRYMNCFTNKEDKISRIYNHHFFNSLICYFCKIFNKIVDAVINFTKFYNDIIFKLDRKYIPHIKKFHIKTLTSDNMLFKIQYFSRRLDGILQIKNVVDFFICGYQEQIDGWSRYIKKDILIFPYYISENCFKLIKISFPFF